MKNDRYITYNTGLEFDLQRFASVSATASSEYTITLPDNSTKATVTVSGGTITNVKYGTSEVTATSGYYLINGYRVTLSYANSKLTSTAVKEEESTNITTSQVYSVTVDNDTQNAKSVTVTGGKFVDNTTTYTTTVSGKTVTLTVDNNGTPTGTYDKTTYTTATSVKSYTLKVGNTDIATVTVDSNSNIKVNGTDYTGTVKVNGYALTLAAENGALKTASAAEIKSTTTVSEATNYIIQVNSYTTTVTVDNGTIKNSAGNTITNNKITVNGKEVTLTYDSQNKKLTGTYETSETLTPAKTIKFNGTTLTDGMIIEPHFAHSGDNSVQFKYDAASGTFTPNYTSENEVYSNRGPMTGAILNNWWNQNKASNLLYLTRSGNTLHLYGNDGIDMTVFDIQIDFKNMTYSQSYKEWYKDTIGSLTSLLVGGTNYGSYNKGTISDLTDGFSEAYTVTINNQTYSVEFDSDNKIKKIGDADVANGKVTINSTEYNLSEDGKSIQVLQLPLLTSPPQATCRPSHSPAIPTMTKSL